MNSIFREDKHLTTGVKTESVEKLLNHIAYQTQHIEKKLAIIIDNHIKQDIQNYNNDVNNTLTSMMQFNESVI